MAWTESEIRHIFSQKDFTRGKEYCQRNQVIHLESEMDGDMECVHCQVRGSQTYDVTFAYLGDNVRVHCTCPRYAEKRICKHIAAAMLAHAKGDQNEIPLRSDSHARELLNAYIQRSKREEFLHPGKAQLKPHIYAPAEREYPMFSFSVGFDRMYVVRDIKSFLESVTKKETVNYGKNLRLYHGIEQFDTFSQQLILLLMDQVKAMRSLGYTDNHIGYYYPGYYTEDMIGLDPHHKNRVQLTGSAFDHWFDLLKDKPIEAENKRVLTMTEGNPSITLSLRKNKRAAELSWMMDTEQNGQEWTFFGSTQSLYAMSDNQIFRCDAEFCARVQPLLHQGSRKMQIAFSDLPTFCVCVLPEIQELVNIQDPGNLLQEYLPDECTVCFYFDMEADTLFLRLAYRYHQKEYDSYRPRIPDSVKRDVAAEQSAQRLAERFFQTDGKRYTLTGDDAIYDFLSEQIEIFHEHGEVFMTESLRERRLQPARAAVGISVANGILTLDIDTGGFPIDELEALYQSLLKKRRYYRLKDGRYFTLDGSACETLAEMTHMLQLSPKELSEGKMKLPAFRGLYVDHLLAGSDGIQVQRDRQFRAMIRNFKSVSESDYILPENLDTVLRTYQKTGFQWLKTLESCGFGGILADEMGLGKTVQIIAFLQTVTQEVTGKPSLIICPASLILNWMDELTKFAPSLRVSLIMGPAAERKRIIQQSTQQDVWVTSYELLRQDVNHYQDLEFYCCVLDEGQHIKNQSTLASKAVKRIDCCQRFVLTGTPIENRLSELWNLFDFLMPGYLFTHHTFVEKLEKPIVKVADENAAAQLRKLVQPFMLRRLKQDVLKELPPKIEYVRRIPVSEEEKKIYFASAAESRKKLESGEGGKFAILAALTQLRQICCAPQLCFENYKGENSKLEAALELCTGMVENGHQILLFSQFTSMLDIIRERLDKLHISNFTLQGSTPKEKRAQLVKAFNAGEASVFLISLKAGGTGLNLTAADIVIHYDPWWNLAAQDQATDRAHRIGQQAHVQVYKLIAKDTIEEKILELQSKKAALMDTVSDGSDASILTMSQEDLLALL